MTDALKDGLNTIAEIVLKLVLFLVTLVIGIIVVKAIGKALSALLERVGFDRAGERGGVNRALENSKMDASDIIAKLVYYTLMLFVLQRAFGVSGPNPISELLTQVITFLPSLSVAIVILVVALNQVGVALTVTTPVLIAILATVGGLIVVGRPPGRRRPVLNVHTASRSARDSPSLIAQTI